MSQPFRIAIAGLGTVGAGVIEIVQRNASLLEQRIGRPVEIAGISARDKKRDRGVDVSGYTWKDSPLDLLALKDVDAVLELIGGADGVAYDLVKKALSKGIHVVTANKALLAHHGYALAEIAEKNGAALEYEAAVAGCVPVIRALREGFSANQIKSVYGILNGTSNYILTAMREKGAAFADVLKDAQAKGYAEADPTFDVGGVDAAHKLCILTALAFGVKPDFDAVMIRGIEDISYTDIMSASELGYRIKLLGLARSYDGKITQSVEPCLVPVASPLGTIEDVYNAVFIEGDFVETPLVTGLGAGKHPTASAVMADVVALARGTRVPAFGMPCTKLALYSNKDVDKITNRYYMRLVVLDRPGVIADVSAILRDHHVSIESLIQHGRDPDQPVAVVMITHEVKHADARKAAHKIGALESVTGEPCLMRIEEL